MVRKAYRVALRITAGFVIGVGVLVAVAALRLMAGPIDLDFLKSRVTEHFDVPDANRTPIHVLEAGTTVKVLEATEEWLKVEFNDPPLGARVGYVSRLNCSYREKP